MFGADFIQLVYVKGKTEIFVLRKSYQIKSGLERHKFKMKNVKNKLKNNKFSIEGQK